MTSCSTGQRGLVSATVVKARAEERKKRSPGTWSNDVVHKHVEEVEDVDKGEAPVSYTHLTLPTMYCV